MIVFVPTFGYNHGLCVLLHVLSAGLLGTSKSYQYRLPISPSVPPWVGVSSSLTCILLVK